MKNKQKIEELLNQALKIGESKYDEERVVEEIRRSRLMKKRAKDTPTLLCPLIDGVIDRDLCTDVQACIEGSLPVELQYEDFLEKENYEEICSGCMASAHIILFAYSSRKLAIRLMIILSADGWPLLAIC